MNTLWICAFLLLAGLIAAAEEETDLNLGEVLDQVDDSSTAPINTPTQLLVVLLAAFTGHVLQL